MIIVQAIVYMTFNCVSGERHATRQAQQIREAAFAFCKATSGR
jgi:hypothetical protein